MAGKTIRFVWWLSAVPALVAVLVLVFGWFFDIGFFQRILPGYPAMVPETAGIILIGAVGVLRRISHKRCPFSLVCALVILLLAVLERTQSLFKERLSAGDAMAVETIVCALLLALAFVVPWVTKRRTELLEIIIWTFGLSITFIPALGYALRLSDFFLMPMDTAMALHTVFGFMGLFLSMLIVEGLRLERNSS